MSAETPSPGPTDLGVFAGAVGELAQAFVSLASDIALVLDEHGTITRVVQGPNAPLGAAAQQWVGRPWVDTVTGDTRRKVENLLGDVASQGIARRREVNHASPGSDGIPVAYTAVRLGEHGPVLAVGRDLRAVAAIQQRFVESQQELERGYWQARQTEGRWRLLFQVATDAVMTVDALTLAVIEANAGADQMFGSVPAGAAALSLFNSLSQGAVSALFTTARSSARPMEINALLASTNAPVGVAATAFRADDTMRLLVRVRTAQPALESGSRDAALARLVDAHHEGIVVTDASGRLRLANPAFVRWVQARSEGQLLGQGLARWLDADTLHGLLHQVQRQGLAERGPLALLEADGAPPQMMLSAVLLTEGDQETIGLTLRPVLAAPAPEAGAGATLQQELGSLMATLGQHDLEALLAHTRSLAERHFATAALQQSAGDAARAGALLGISAQQVLTLSAAAPNRGGQGRNHGHD